MYLQNEQRLYVAGCEIGGAFEQSLYSTRQSSHIPDPSLRCNAPEADTRIWLHAMHCVNTSGLNTQIVSADTDTVFRESVNSGLDYWNGLLDWTIGLTFDLKFSIDMSILQCV